MKKILVVLFILLCLIVSIGEIKSEEYIISSPAYNTVVQGTSTASTTAPDLPAKFNLTLYHGDVSKPDNILLVDYSSVAFTVISSQAKDSIIVPMTIHYPNNNYLDMGTCNLHFNYLSDISSTTRYYRVYLDNFVWNSVGIQDYAFSSVDYLNVSYTIPTGYKFDLLYRSTTVSGYDGDDLPLGGLAIRSHSNSGSYNIFGRNGAITTYSLMRKLGFYNTITATKDENDLVTYNIGRTYKTQYMNTYSNVTIEDATGVLYVSLWGSNNVTGSAFSPPVKFTIKDYVNFATYVQYAFTPNFSYLITPTEFTINDYPTGIMHSTSNLGNSIAMYSVEDITEGNKNTALYNPTGTYKHNYYKNSSGYWLAYTGSGGGYTTSLGKTFPNNIALKFSKGGNRIVRTSIYDEWDNNYIIDSNVSIIGTGTKYLSAYPIDYSTGSFVSGAIVSIRDDQTKIWTNRTVLIPSDCQFLVNPGFYTIVGSASGYITINNGAKYVGEDGASDQINLIPLTISGGISGDITNSSVILKLRENDTLNPISGAYATINNDTKITSYTGSVTFNLKNNTEYSVSFIANGYNSVTQYFIPNSNPYLLDIVTTEGSNTPITYYSTVPTTVTPIYTVSITQTGIGGQAVNNTPYVCGVNDKSIIGIFMSNFACNGITDRTSQNLTMAGLICMIFILAGARYGKGLGGAFGGITGFVISLAAGLIPFWVFAALIIVGVLALAILAIFRGQS